MPVIPAPGQIWRDPRNPAREVRIVTVNDLKLMVWNYKSCRCSSISRENFTSVVPERNRWIFVSDAPGERAKLG